MKIDEFGLLHRHLHGFSLVCFLKPATPLTLSRPRGSPLTSKIVWR